MNDITTQRSLFSTMFFRHQRLDNDEFLDRDEVPEVDSGDRYKWNKPLHSAVEAGLEASTVAIWP